MKRFLIVVVGVMAMFAGIWSVNDSSAVLYRSYEKADLQVITHPDLFRKWPPRKEPVQTTASVTPTPTPTPTPEPEGPDVRPTETPVSWQPLPDKIIYFDYDKSFLRQEAKAAIQRNVEYLKENPDSQVLIEGHCDERGTAEYNIALGERRAESVKDYMTQLGISSGRITTKSWGEERPVASGNNEEAWQQNRRAEMYFSEE